VDRIDFRNSLLTIMERKQDPDWQRFTAGEVPADLLHHHLEQEWEVYVRDFPVMVGWAYVQCPVAEVRRELAENLYEEETGGIVAGKPHPELFLEYPKGLGMDLARFDAVELCPAAEAYRAVLDDMTQTRGWAVAAAVVTLFVEGTANERDTLDGIVRPPPPLDQHPLVLHYGLPLEALALTRAHRSVEGDHRVAAWKIVLDHAPESEHISILAAMDRTLGAWLHYRSAVARLCGV